MIRGKVRVSRESSSLNKVPGVVAPVTRIREGGGRPSKGGSFDAVIPNCCIRVSHFDCHLCTAKHDPRWCDLFDLEI